MNAITDDDLAARYPTRFVTNILGDVLTSLITTGTITVDLYTNAVEVHRGGDQLARLLGTFTTEQTAAMLHIDRSLIIDRTTETFTSRDL